ncbi:MAG: hypothetical protein RMM51_05580 [Verrucomicrobiae bacterium]|nr:hypothetical protein [Verrucomicrobiae bacterium]
MSGWSWQVSGSAVVLMVAVWCVAAWLGWRQWNRYGRRRSVGLLELFRLGVVGLALLTLGRPERIERVGQTTMPTVAVLVDASGSMATRDVTDAAGQLVSRWDWARQTVAEAPWRELTNRYQVVVEEFDKPAGDDAAVEQGTDLSAALEGALVRHRALRAVVLLSDGDWNMGRPPVVGATRLQAAGVPVFGVAVGREEYLPDVVVERVAAPTYALVGEQVVVAATLRNWMAQEVTTTLRLRDGRGSTVEKPVTIAALGQRQETLVWTPMREGSVTLQVSVPVISGETHDDNNEQTVSVSVRQEKLRVLVLESVPRWEYRYLRNALQRDPGVEVRTVLWHPGMSPGAGKDYLPGFPASRDELSTFDVVFVGDVGVGDGELTAEQCAELRGLVEQQGSGLVFLPGPRGRIMTLRDTELGPLIPVELDASEPRGLRSPTPSQLVLTARGQDHLLTMLASTAADNAQVWRKLPGFYWCASVQKARPGTDVLAVHESRRNEWGRMPLLVARLAGNGKVLFMGTDGAWRWRRGVEDVYHYRFWGQVVRWMSYQRHLAHTAGIRLFYNPDAPQRGETVTVHATVLDAGGLPLTSGRVLAEVRGPGGTTERMELSAVPGGWGVFRGQFIPESVGTYRLRVEAEATGRSVETELDVRGMPRERVGHPARPDVIREIASITGGRAGGVEELSEFVRQIQSLPERDAVERRVRLWCHPLWAGILVGLLAVYWVGRKWLGLV